MKLLAPNYCLLGCDAMQYMVCTEQPSSSIFLRTLTLSTRLHGVISEALGDWEAQIWHNERASQLTWKPLICNYYDMQYVWTKNFACQEPQYFCLEGWPCHISKINNIYYVCSLLVPVSTLPYSVLFQTLPLPAKVKKKKQLCYEKYKMPLIFILVHG